MTEQPSTRVRSWRGAAAVVLAAGTLEATFLPELGLLGASLRDDGEELLALPSGLAGYRSGHQAGLPLLAPWANRLGGLRYEAAGVTVDLDGLGLHTDGNGLPIHGTMTAQVGWEIERLDPGVLRARFAYGDRPDLLAAFPFPHDLVVEAALDVGGLTVATTLRPTGERAVPVAFGWHPYLRLPRVPRRSWRLVLPAREHVELDERGLPTGRSTAEAAEAEPVGDRTFDDLYALGADRTCAIEGGDRRLAVQYGEGYPYAQVFAPPGAGFVCLEPMTALTDALGRGDAATVEAGDELTARFTVAPSRPV
jgi:galactose mutarotase-like enzyme